MLNFLPIPVGPAVFSRHLTERPGPQIPTYDSARPPQKDYDVIEGSGSKTPRSDRIVDSRGVLFLKQCRLRF